MKKIVLFLGFLCMACAGDNADGVNCTEDVRPGLIVTVKDAVTGTILGESATVTATDGDYNEDLEFIDNSSHFMGAYERAGNYTLTVSVEGYQEYVSGVVEVDEDECHVMTEELSIQLQPQ